MQWCRWGLNPQPLSLEKSTLPLSHCAHLIEKLIFLFHNQNICYATQKNGLGETVLLSTQNTPFNGWLRKYAHFYVQKVAILDLWAVLAGKCNKYQNLYNWLICIICAQKMYCSAYLEPPLGYYSNIYHQDTFCAKIYNNRNNRKIILIWSLFGI